MKHILFIGFITLMFFGTACETEKTEDATSSISIQPKAFWGEEDFELGETYQDVLGHYVRASTFNVYIAKIYLTNSAGEDVLISPVELTKFSDPQVITSDIPDGDYNKIKLGIGVPEEWNKDSDPTQYENDHPLSAIGGASMFWSWNTGYIFIKFDGHTDLTGNDPDNLTDPFAFHCGEDFLYTQHEFDKVLTINPGSDVSLDLNFHVDRFFYSENDTINLEEDFTTHTSGNVELAERFTALFNEAIDIE